MSNFKEVTFKKERKNMTKQYQIVEKTKGLPDRTIKHIYTDKAIAKIDISYAKKWYARKNTTYTIKEIK